MPRSPLSLYPFFKKKKKLIYGPCLFGYIFMWIYSGKMAKRAQYWWILISLRCYIHKCLDQRRVVQKGLVGPSWAGKLVSKKSVQFASIDSRLVTPWCTCLVLIGFMQGACCHGLPPMLIIAPVAEWKSWTLQLHQQINSLSSSAQYASMINSCLSIYIWICKTTFV